MAQSRCGPFLDILLGSFVDILQNLCSRQAALTVLQPALGLGMAFMQHWLPLTLVRLDCHVRSLSERGQAVAEMPLQRCLPCTF